MRTRIFWNHQTGERFELSEEQAAERRNKQNGPMVLPDIDRAYGGGFVSPVDGSHITSRSQLRRHNATHQCRQAGDFKRGELISKEKARVESKRQRAQNSGVTFEWH
jgi:hypothetical protein